MKLVRLILQIAMCMSCLYCYGQTAYKNGTHLVKGTLVIFSGELYLFQTNDTILSSISDSNLVGLKLGKIDFADVLEKISYKRSVSFISVANNDQVDTIRSAIGVMPVSVKFARVNTELSSDTSAFSIMSRGRELVYRYEIRFDLAALDVQPSKSADKRIMKKYLNRL